MAANTMDAMKRNLPRSRRRARPRPVRRRVLGGWRLADEDRVRDGSAGRTTASAATQRRRRSTPATTSTPDEHDARPDEHRGRDRGADDDAHRARAGVHRQDAARGRRERRRGARARTRLHAQRHLRIPPEGQTLRVLVGTRTGSGDGYGQQAFFFVGGRYIGTDTKEPSATVRVRLPERHRSDARLPALPQERPAVLPRRGQATVRFPLNNGHLTALGTIPPASRGSTPSRY